jgi:CHAT domain-containing protein/tetratricopeptide (TPR) repeat protein
MKRVRVLILAVALLAAVPAGRMGARAQGGSTAEPPPPMPSAAVQKLLDEAARLGRARQTSEALQAADRALAAAREAGDAAGEARGQQERARELEASGRTDEAVAAWRAAAEAWERAGDGSERARMLAAAGLLLVATKTDEADGLFAQAAAAGLAETRRPLSASGALNAAGAACFSRRRLVQARALGSAALAILEKRAPGTLFEAQTLHNLGLVAGQQGDLSAADGYYRRALALQEKLAPETPTAAGILSGLGTVSWMRGDLAAAQEFHQRALTLHEKLAPGSLSVALDLHNLGVVAQDREEMATGQEYHLRALALREKLAPDSLLVANSLNSLGIAAQQRGDLEGGMEYHRRALALREKLAPQSPDVSQSLNNLGNGARKQGELAAAEEYFRRALALHERIAPRSQAAAGCLGNLGLVAKDQGDLAAAREYLRRALALHEQFAPDSRRVATDLLNLGVVAEMQSDFAAAEGYYRRALALDEKLAPNSLSVASSLGNMGNVALHRGDPRAALDYHRQSLALQERLAPGSLPVATSLINLGEVALAQRNLPAAREYQQRALALREHLAPRSLGVAQSLLCLARTALAQGDLAEAERRAGRAWELARQQAGSVSGDEARRAFGAANALIAATLMRAQVARGRPAAALATLEESRAQSLLQLLLERRLDTRSVSADLQAAHRAAVRAQDQAEQTAAAATVAKALAWRDLAAAQEGTSSPEDLQRRREALAAATKSLEEAQSRYTLARVEADQSWSDIRRSAPRLFPAPFLPEEARKALPAGTLFLAYAVRNDQLYVFLLHANPPTRKHGPAPGRSRPVASAPAVSVQKIALTSEELRNRVIALRQQITDPKADAAATVRASRSLFAALFPPPVRREVQRAPRLLVSPDGPLWELPFAALITNAAGAPRYLGQEKPITSTPSLTLFAQCRGERRRQTPAGTPRGLVVGNPLFERGRTQLASSPTGASLIPNERAALFMDGRCPAPLPGTAREATDVAALYRGELLMGENATEAAVRERVGNADIIHLATHSYLHPTRAMSSGVLLAEPAEEPAAGQTSNDGALQAWEIYSQLKLTAELVVLSACETGRGENVQGEGIVGLVRALQYAGARSVVASQWKVADESTSRLMVAFHRKLRAGLAKDEALRQAMAVVRSDPRWAHPYYWAAFFLTGDPDNPNLGRR